MELLRNVKKTVKKYDLIQPGNKLLLGISGGADSTGLALALLRFRQEWNLSVHLLHVNHQLRGKESERDEQFVRQLAKKWHLKLYCPRLNPLKLRSKSGGSLEDQARRERYRLFVRYARRIGADAIALAHHRNDLAETVLMRLIRGAGKRGLVGFLAKSYYQGQLIIRPFFESSRQEIMAFLRAQNQPWVEDSSNKDKRFLRNKIRLLLIPYLERNFNPAIVKSLTHTAQLLADEELLLEQQAEEKLNRAPLFLDKAEKIESLRLSFLNDMPLALLRRVLRLWLLRFARMGLPPDYKYIDSLIGLIKERPAGKKIHLFSSIAAYKDYEQIIVTKDQFNQKALKQCLLSSRMTAEYPLVIMPEGKVIKIGKEQLSDSGQELVINLHGNDLILQKQNITAQLAKEIRKSGRDKTIEYFDFRKLRLPLTIRTRQDGDLFKPLGVKGAIKLKKFFIDQKIPRLLRDRIGLLCDAERILWVIGMRISDDVKIDKKTKQLLKATIIREIKNE